MENNKFTKKISIDIVLLPSENVRDLAIRLNNEMYDKYGDYVRMATFGYQPHISLCMASVSEENFSAIKDNLKHIAEKTKTIQLEIFDNLLKGSAWLEVKQTNEIQMLHGEVCRLFEGVERFPTTPNMLSEVDAADIVSSQWVDDFMKKHVRNDFRPHLSYGLHDPMSKLELPTSFTSNTIAIFQLGPYCSCKKELARFKLI